jgi:hypothetical protein
MTAPAKPASAPKSEPEGKRKPRPSAKQGWAIRLRGSLLRLCEWRSANGVITPDSAATLVADAAVFGPGGLTPESFKRLAGRMRLTFPQDVIEHALDCAFDKLMRCDGDLFSYWMPSAEEAGRLLGLTKHERHLIEQDLKHRAKTLPPLKAKNGRKRRFVTTISAIIGTDETREDVQAEREERRKAQERARGKQKRRRAYKARKERERRAKAGATPRVQCLARTEPWKSLGISRDTWYRRGKPSPSDEFVGKSEGQTPDKPPENGQTNSWTACTNEVITL